MLNPSDSLLDQAERWINDYKNKEGSSLFDWNKASIEEYKDVSLDTLLNDSYFLGLKDRLYEGVYKDLVDLWEEKAKREINLAVFLEGIGSGKSFKSSIILWLLWYELSMNVNPQTKYGLAEDSIIAIMLMSRSATQSKRVVFNYTWDRFQTGFNKDYFPANPRYSSEVRIDRNKTCVYAGTSSALSALGYNLFSAVIDEANYLEVTEDSKKAEEEIYDAGEDMYNAIMNRMTSRFMIHGKIPGIIICISSPRYPDSFMERKIKEIKAVGAEELKAFWRQRSLWEAKGSKYFNLDKYFVVDTETLKIIDEVT